MLKKENSGNIQKFWDKHVREFYYDEPSKFLYKYFSAINFKHSNILDIGCGAGRNLIMLYKFGFNIYGCDLNKKMVQAARRRFPGPIKKNIDIASMIRLPYKNNFFDYVISNGVFHNACNYKEFKIAIKEASRVLRKGGHLIINIFVAKGLEKKFEKISGSKYLYSTSEKLPIILLPPNKLFKLFRNNGFKLVSCFQQRVLVSTGRRDLVKAILFKK